MGESQWDDTFVEFNGKEIGKDRLLAFHDPTGCRLETVHIAIEQQRVIDRTHGGIRNDAELLSEVIIVQWAIILPRWKSWVIKKLLNLL